MQLRLLPKMLLFILFPAIAGLGILTYAGNRLADEGMRMQINEDLQLAVNLQARELGNITTIVHSIAGYLAQTPAVQAYLAALAKGEHKDVLEVLHAPAQEEAVTLANSFGRVRDTALVNIKGEIVAHTDPETIGTKVADRDYFKEALAGNPSSATVVSRANNTTITMLAVPVKVEGKVVGVVYASVHMDNLAQTTTDAIKVAQTGVCYVYDRDGRTIMHPNRKMVGDENKDHPWTWDILKDPKTAIHYNWNGVDKVAHYAKVPGVDWWVVLGVDEADVFQPVTSMTQNLLIIAALVALVVGLTIFIMAKGLADVLQEGATFTAYVAEGNLDIDPALQSKLQVACTRGDEIGLLARSIGTLVTNLAGKIAEAESRSKQAEQAMAEAHDSRVAAEASAAEAVNARREGMLAAAQQLESVVAVISSASTQLAAQIEQSERGSAQQASRLTETATAMEEMNSTVLEVARNAASASDVSVSTRQRAEEGAAVVLKAVEGIKEVQSQSLQMKTDMERLDQNAQAISNIMGVISDIADQTNLLALNAAIEAARAGEAGRGFAVVADEVRKLAEKTMTSTTDVGNAIRAIQKSVTESMSQVDSSVAAVEHATDFANQSGIALKEIVTLVDSSADQVRAIATASEQQSSSSEEINSSINQINGIAGETARAMQEAAQAVSDLAQQAQILGNLIEDMKRA